MPVADRIHSTKVHSATWSCIVQSMNILSHSNELPYPLLQMIYVYRIFKSAVVTWQWMIGYHNGSSDNGQQDTFTTDRSTVPSQVLYGWLLGIAVKSSTRHMHIERYRHKKANPPVTKNTGPRLNIKTVLFTCGDFHVKDKTAVRTSYL